MKKKLLYPIILRDHNPCYKDWYESEKKNILTYISSENIYRINHIGSTAVKSLVAKPTVDILLELNIRCDGSQLIETLKDNGWGVISSEIEPKMKFALSKGYTPNGFAEKVYHLHVRYLDNWNELYFRDYLIEHSEVAEEYGKLKMSLGKIYEYNREGYTEAKTEFINKHTEKAKLKYADRYVPRV